jgi:hypothetical protein
MKALRGLIEWFSRASQSQKSTDAGPKARARSEASVKLEEVAQRRLDHRKAQIARLRAFNKAKDAEERGDDRDLGRARMELSQATHDLLRTEVGR